MKTTLSVILFLVSISFSYGQYTDQELKDIIEKSSDLKLVQENTHLMLLKFYYQSIQIADKLLEKSPDNANYNYRKGYALLYSQSDFTKTLPYLEKASLSVDKNYDASNNTEKSAPIDVFYHLGHCYHLAGDIDKAEVNFQKYLEIAPKDNELVYFTQMALKQCEVAKYNLQHPNPEYELKNLGPKINSEYPDYSPVVSLDGTALYFTSRRLWEDSSNFSLRDPKNGEYYEDIYVAYKDFDEDWEDPIRLLFCKNDKMEATVSVSADERRIYVYEDSLGNGDIYYSNFQTNHFEDVQDYAVKGINTKAWETHVTVTPDGNNIYFVSDREGGYGGRDIYRIVKLPNGDWSEPINLGPTINTAFDEDAPFIAVDNKSMYFASNGETSMGGFDIFLSIRDERNNWSTPVNLGYPLNSTGDDLFYTTTVDGLTGYLTSFRLGGQGEKDIYEIKNNYLGMNNISVLKGQITVDDGRPLPEDISITVNCLDCGNTNTRKVFPRVRDGVYFSSLDKCREYELIYKYGADEKEFHRQTIKTGCDNKYEEIYLPVLLHLDDMTIHPADGYKIVGKVTDSTSETPLDSALVTIYSKDGEVLETIYTDNEGNFKSDLLESKVPGDKIDLIAKITKDGYLTKETAINQILGKDKNIILNYKSERAVIGSLIKVDPIYFDLNSSYLRADAKVELDKIVKIMNDNPKIKIELSSHTDCRESAKYNMWLSERRAKSSATYIQKRISDPSRIYGKGYGETQLVNDCGCEGDQKSNCSEEQHQANRRTEFKIIE